MVDYCYKSKFLCTVSHFEKVVSKQRWNFLYSGRTLLLSRWQRHVATVNSYWDILRCKDSHSSGSVRKRKYKKLHPLNLITLGCVCSKEYNERCLAKSTEANSMSLLPGQTKCYNFSFVAKTEDVGRKIEVRLNVKERMGQQGRQKRLDLGCGKNNSVGYRYRDWGWVPYFLRAL